MNEFNNAQSGKEVEVRGFSFIKKIFDKRGLSSPTYIRLEKECSAVELAEMMDLPLEKIEAVFVNGVASPIAKGWVKPGDRVAFVPPGTPGPYRGILGMVEVSDKKNGDS